MRTAPIRLLIIAFFLGCGDSNLTKYGPECGDGTTDEDGVCVPDDDDTGLNTDAPCQLGPFLV